MSLQIKKPGLLTTIQDTGRYGFQKIGVLVSGAMDVYSMRLANILVGNDENEGCLELTLFGPAIKFTEDSLIAITGGNFSPTLNGHPVPLMRPVAVKADSAIEFKFSQFGCRAYLAIAGGFNIKRIMKSKSTYLRAGIGGFNGRALKEDDLLSVNTPSIPIQHLLYSLTARSKDSLATVPWYIKSIHIDDKTLYAPIRVTKGLYYDYFSEQAKASFFNTPYTITNNADRMGYRLDGAVVKPDKHLEIISEAVCLGTIQVPPQGKPIILMSDHQSVAGYPTIAQAITVDTSRIAQLKPGDQIRFQLINNEEAEHIFIAMEKYIKTIRETVTAKLNNYK